MFRFLIDECVPEKVATAIRGWNAANSKRAIDIVLVGHHPELPKHTPDPDLLLWSEANDHILVKVDYESMPSHLANHLAAGHHLPGILSIRPGTTIIGIVEDLVMIAYAGDPDEYRDTITYIPL